MNVDLGLTVLITALIVVPPIFIKLVAKKMNTFLIWTVGIIMVALYVYGWQVVALNSGAGAPGLLVLMFLQAFISPLLFTSEFK